MGAGAAAAAAAGAAAGPGEGAPPAAPLDPPAALAGAGAAGRVRGGGGLLLRDRAGVERSRARGGRPKARRLRGEPLSFDKGVYVVARCCQKLLAALREPPGAEGGEQGSVVVAGLAGPSGAGKSVFAERLQGLLPGIAQLRVDDFVPGGGGEPRAAADPILVPGRGVEEPPLPAGAPEGPQAVDFGALRARIRELRDGPEEGAAPGGGGGRGGREGRRPRIVLVVGAYALHAEIQDLLDLRVAISGGVHFDLIKRIRKDISRQEKALAGTGGVAKRSKGDLLNHITETVFPNYVAWVAPDLEGADVRIRNEFNPLASLHQDASYSLKSEQAVLEGRIGEVLLQLAAECGAEARAGGEDAHPESEETRDFYLLPPGRDLETCKDWIRLRFRDAHYSIHFEEYITEGPVVISPNLAFDVPVQTLSGLMTVGYTIGAILKRKSRVFRLQSPEQHRRMGGLVIKSDAITQLDRTFTNITGENRALVERAGQLLGLEGKYNPRPYIEQVQLERLTQECRVDSDGEAGGGGGGGGGGRGGGGGGGGDGGGPPAPGSASLPVAGAAGAAGACGAATGREGEGARSGSSYGVEGGDELLSDLGASPMPEMATSPGGTGVVTSARKREFHRGAAPGSSTRGFKVPQQSSDSPWGAHPQAQLPAQDPATPPRDAGASLLPRPSALRAEGDAPPPAGEDAVPSQGSRGGAMAQRRLWGKSPSEVPVGGEGGSAPKAMGGPGRAFAPPAPGSPLLALLSSNELPGALQAARTTASAANAPGSAAGAARPQDEEVERVLRSLRTSQMALVKHVGSLGDALMAVHATQVAAAESAPEALGPWHAGPGWLAGAAVVALNAALAGALLLHARAGP